MTLPHIVTKLAGEIAVTLAEAKARIEFRRAFHQFSRFTMISEDVYIDNLRLAARIRNLNGSVVECGTWRGGMAAGLASVLGTDREYYLFDSFEGLPPAKEIDGIAALGWQSDRKGPMYFDNCSADESFAREAMSAFPDVQLTIKKGWFEATIPGFVPKAPIALLRLDGDWYESTIICLKHLFPHVMSGGIIIIDDYYTWDGCSRAVHDYLSQEKAIERVSSFNNSVCYIRKA